MPINLTDYSSYSASPVGMHKVGMRQTAPLPSIGSPKVPVILVQFADKAFTLGSDNKVSSEQANKKYAGFFNKKDGNASPSIGSVYQYFNEQSYGQFTPEFQIIGPVTLSKGYAYYGADSEDMKDYNIDAFFREACQLAMKENSVDWSAFDNNEDGIVDMVFFIYAGNGQNYSDDANTIWPKEKVDGMSVIVDGETIKFGAYGCASELYGNNFDGIGVCCHELSHGIGLPDLYDVNYKGGLGMDMFDIMDGGVYQMEGKCPCAYTAYERDFMGWRPLTVVGCDESLSLVLDPIETTGYGYKVVNKADPNEYFILENRQNLGYDKYLPMPNDCYYEAYGASHGLQITYVHYSSYAWINNEVNTLVSHQRMTIVPADGAFDSDKVERFGDWATSALGDLYPGKFNVTEMSDYTVYTGGKLGQRVTNIREEGGQIFLDIISREADAIGETSVGDVPAKIYGIDGSPRTSIKKGINIINGKKEVLR